MAHAAVSERVIVKPEEAWVGVLCAPWGVRLRRAPRPPKRPVVFAPPRVLPVEGRHVSVRLRFEVLKRDGYACRYCGARAPDVRLHVDHVVPVSKGGTNDPDNLVAACRDCNLGKSDK